MPAKKTTDDTTKFRFTDPSVRAHIGKSGRYTDLSCPGLSLVVTRKGKLAFMHRWRDARGTSIATVIGHYLVPTPQKGEPAFAGHMSISAARTKIAELKQAHRFGGVDPRINLHSKKLSSLTLADDVEAYIVHREATWKKPTDSWRVYNTRADLVRAQVKRYCPHLLDRQTHRLTAQDILATVQIIEAKPDRWGRPTGDQHMASSIDELLILLKAIIQQAMRGAHKARWSPGAVDPVTALEDLKLLAPYDKTPAHALPLTATADDDPPVTELYARLLAYRQHAATATGRGDYHKRLARNPEVIRLLLLTCTPRIHEVLQARWEQFSLEGDNPVWKIPAPEMKVPRRKRQAPRKTRDIPLSYFAVALLLSLRPTNPAPGDYVFQGQRRAARRDATENLPMVASGVLRMLRQLGFRKGTVHGLRSTLLNYVLERHPVSLVFAAKESLDHPLFHDVSEVYKRSVLPVQRRILGDLFGAFLESGLPPEQRTPCPPHAIARMQTYLAPPPEWQQMIAMA
jgi:hypothetical protein